MSFHQMSCHALLWAVSIAAIGNSQRQSRGDRRIRVNYTLGTSLLQSRSHIVTMGSGGLRGQRQPKILYGIESCDSEAYNLMVKAQLETWAKQMPRENLIIVGGAYDDQKHKLVESEMPCKDSQDDLACKEGVMLARAVDRARKLNADWLVVSQDDKYIWPEAMEQALSKVDAGTPQVYSSYGCGQAWKYHKDSDLGHKPFPNGWFEPPFSCKAVYEGGGICGGVTYIVSRAALEKLYHSGQSASEFVAEFLAGSQGPGAASDLSASCMFHSRDIPFKNRFEKLGVVGTVSMSDINEKGMESYIAEHFSNQAPPLALHISFGKDLIPRFIKKTHDADISSLLQNERTSISDFDIFQREANFLYALHERTIEGFLRS